MQHKLTMTFADGQVLTWSLAFSEWGTLRLDLQRSARKRPWVRLSFRRCRCCTLKDGPYATCPVADVVLEYAADLAERSSCDMVTVRVHDSDGPEVSVGQMALQDAAGELIRLALYQAGCPIGRRIKPAMAALGLFPSRDEVLTALAEHFARMGGESEADAARCMDDLHEVFCALGRRLSAAGSGDVYLNALVVQEALASLFRLTAPELIRSALLPLPSPTP